MAVDNWSASGFVEGQTFPDSDVPVSVEDQTSKLAQRNAYHEKVGQLNMPTFLKEFLTYVPDIKALEEEEAEESERVGRSFAVDETVGVPGMELDLDAMD